MGQSGHVDEAAKRLTMSSWNLLRCYGRRKRSVKRSAGGTWRREKRLHPDFQHPDLDFGPAPPELSLPFHDAQKIRKSKPVNGEPPTRATIPTTTECHLTRPKTKSTTAPIEKKTTAEARLISTALCSTRRNLCDSNGNSRKMSVIGIFRQSVMEAVEFGS